MEGAGLISLIETFGLASGIARSRTVYAAVSALHVLGIALLLGPILAVDTQLLGLHRRFDSGAMAWLRRLAAGGLLLAMLTGALLFTARPGEYLANPAFLAKLALITGAVANALVLAWRFRRSPSALPRLAALAAGISALLWLAVLSAGRWIAFVN